MEKINFFNINQNNEKSFDEKDKIISLQEGEKDSHDDILEENRELNPVVSFVKEQYSRAKNKKEITENRLLECYRNFIGRYGPDVQFTETEKSRAFIKITKTKVLAAASKITEVLFSSPKFPIGVEPTPVVTENIEEEVYFDPKEPKDSQNENSTGDIINTIKRKDLKDKLGPVKKSLDRLPKDVELKSGPGKTPTSFTFEPAQIAAKKMEKTILDQLEEANADKALRNFVFEMCLFGTGIMKGPLVRYKEYPKWNDDGKYSPIIKTIPDVVHVSCWNIYPDPDARSTEDAEFVIERHRLSRSQLRSLKKHPLFRHKSIDVAIEQGPSYKNEDWENILKDNNNEDFNSSSRFEVLEYWGIIDKEIAKKANIEIPDEMENFDQIQVNIWICNDQILRFVLNPFTPVRLPYYACPYEVNPYDFFGIGVAENMLDTQLIMNGFMRLAIDNAVLSSNIVFEVDETNLVPGQDLRMYPGKVLRRQGGVPGQAVNTIKWDNVTQECLMLFDKARQLSDESTGIPSYSHGISGIMSTGKTASGMSMLMKAADENIKSVIRNIDDYLLMPLGKSMFSFNMQFNFDKDIVGDLDVVAKGTESLMRNEVRSQRLLQFLQITGNEMDAPFVKRDYILRELAKTLDLDPDKIVNDPREAAIQAELMRTLNETMGVIPQQQLQQENPSAVSPVEDSTNTGGGNINPGGILTPEEQGFSSNGGQGGMDQQQLVA